jgi:hypothetical protein
MSGDYAHSAASGFSAAKGFMEAKKETAKATAGGRNTQVRTPDMGKLTYRSIFPLEA